MFGIGAPTLSFLLPVINILDGLSCSLLTNFWNVRAQLFVQPRPNSLLVFWCSVFSCLFSTWWWVSESHAKWQNYPYNATFFWSLPSCEFKVKNAVQPIRRQWSRFTVVLLLLRGGNCTMYLNMLDSHELLVFSVQTEKKLYFPLKFTLKEHMPPLSGFWK